MEGSTDIGLFFPNLERSQHLNRINSFKSSGKIRFSSDNLNIDLNGSYSSQKHFLTRFHRLGCCLSLKKRKYLLIHLWKVGLTQCLSSHLLIGF